jgi:uncharacterized membrane protein SirB2
MIEFYPQIKFVHVLCVILSGSLFVVRGFMMLADSRLANHAALRCLSYAIDTTLLTAALMLVTILHQYPFVQAWLTVKLLLLVVYIVLGVFALRRGRTRLVRAAFFAAAIAVYLFIVSVAWTHDPRGALALIYRALS